MRFANDRAAECAVQARERSAAWEVACCGMGAGTVRTMADEFEALLGVDWFVVNWVSTGRPCVRSVVAGRREFDVAARAFRARLLRALGESA